MQNSRLDGWWRLALAVLLTGVAAGVAGSLLTLLLHAIEHLAFGYSASDFLVGVEQVGPLRRTVAVGIGGAIAGTGWALHRRHLHKTRADDSISVTGALARDAPTLPIVATSTDAVLQVTAVGAGGSLGREGAPRQVGALSGALIAARLGLPHSRRRVLLAAGAGAGLAAVYNVPFGGAAFTAELLLGTAAPSALAIALAVSWIAALTSRLVLGNQVAYALPHVPATPAGVAAAAVAALLLGALIGPLGIAFRAAMTRARMRATSGWRMPIAITVVFLALGAVATRYPQLLGNGKSLTQYDLAAGGTTLTLVVLALLKPVATAACLRSGAIGGLLTPAFATGATVGLLAGRLWTHVWPAGSAAAVAVAGAAAMLAVSQRAPITAVVLAVEFTHASPAVVPAIVVAVAAATTSARGCRALGVRLGRGAATGAGDDSPLLVSRPAVSRS
ncbi:MAG TPA: chloride channel protein [Jatrophihabitans sp.]|jgi:H+/Cl- antiporter ClcA